MLFLFSLFNTVVVYTTNTIDVPYYALHIPLFAVSFLECLFLSNLAFRKSFFAISHAAINLGTINLLVLIITAFTKSSTLLEVYHNQAYFYQALLITSTVLLIIIRHNRKPKNAQGYVQVANARIYSTIMSLISTSLTFFLAMDSYIIMNNKLTTPFFVAELSTLIFILVLYYCLFYFNISLCTLHPFKRKADEAIILHDIVVNKKIETEFKLYTDDLTKLYNRRFIYAKLDKLCESNDKDFSMLFLDLASLKQVNDTYGHKTGDEYIVKVSQVLTSTLRDGDLSARIGGDEFLVILFDVEEKHLDQIVDRIKYLISLKNNQTKYLIHANIGYLQVTENLRKQGRSDILAKVDEYMNKDKLKYYQGVGEKI